jgi:HEAT repeat protein
MPKKKGKSASFETMLAQVGLALRDPRSPENRERLHEALLRAPAILAARVATSIAERNLDGFEGVLEQTFQRFLEDPVKSDPGCRAKLAALAALDRLESTHVATFIAGTAYFQLEPGFGGPVDTAVGIRARAIVALARIGLSDLPLIAAQLINDPASPVRRAAADAIAYHGERAAAGTVWLKFEQGDDDELVTLACASAVLSLAPEWALQALRPKFFGPDAAPREVVALALGEARHPGAIELLFECLDGTVSPQARAVVLRGLALNRSERARVFLLQVIREGNAVEAKAAVAALGVHAHEPGLSERVREAARGNAKVDLRRDLAAAFPAAERP